MDAVYTIGQLADYIINNNKQFDNFYKWGKSTQNLLNKHINKLIIKTISFIIKYDIDIYKNNKPGIYKNINDMIDSGLCNSYDINTLGTHYKYYYKGYMSYKKLCDSYIFTYLDNCNFIKYKFIADDLINAGYLDDIINIIEEYFNYV
jgi:hypothetical protein